MVDKTSVHCLVLVVLATLSLASAQLFRDDYERNQERSNAYQRDNFRHNRKLNEASDEQNNGGSGRPTAFGNIVRELLAKEMERDGTQPDYAGATQADLIRFFQFGDNMTVHVFKGNQLGSNKNNVINNARFRDLALQLYDDPTAPNRPHKNARNNGGRAQVQTSPYSKKQRQNAHNSGRNQASDYSYDTPSVSSFPKRQNKNNLNGGQAGRPSSNYDPRGSSSFPKRQNKNTFNGEQAKSLISNYDPPSPSLFSERQNKNNFNGGQAKGPTLNYGLPSLFAFASKSNKNAFGGGKTDNEGPSSNYGLPGLFALTKTQNKNTFGRGKTEEPSSHYGLSSLMALANKLNNNPFAFNGGKPEDEGSSLNYGRLASLFPFTRSHYNKTAVKLSSTNTQVPVPQSSYGIFSSPYAEKQNMSTFANALSQVIQSAKYAVSSTPPPVTGKQKNTFKSARDEESSSNYGPSNSSFTKKPRNGGRKNTRTRTTTPPPLDDYYDNEDDYDYSDEKQIPVRPSPKKQTRTRDSYNRPSRPRGFVNYDYDNTRNSLRQDLKSMTMANSDNRGQTYGALRYIKIQPQLTLPLQVPARFMVPPPEIIL